MSKRHFGNTSASELKKKLRTECRKRVREGDDWSAKKSKIHLALKRLILEDRDVANPSREDGLQLLSSMESEEYQQFMEKLEDEILQELNTQFTRNNQQGTVLCPLCQDAYLVFHSGMICCPNCHYGLVDGGHGWTMESVRSTLANAYEDHQRSNSAVPLKFKIDTSTNKTYLCSSCSFTSTYQPLFEILNVWK